MSDGCAPSVGVFFVIGQFWQKSYLAFFKVPFQINLNESPDEFEVQSKFRTQTRSLRSMLPGGLNVVGLAAHNSGCHSVMPIVKSILPLVAEFYGPCFGTHAHSFLPFLISESDGSKCEVLGKDEKLYEVDILPMEEDVRLISFTSSVFIDVQLPFSRAMSAKPFYVELTRSISSWLMCLRHSRLVYNNNFASRSRSWDSDDMTGGTFELAIEENHDEEGKVTDVNVSENLTFRGNIICRPVVSTMTLQTGFIEQALTEDLFRSVTMKVLLASAEADTTGTTQLQYWSVLLPVRTEVFTVFGDLCVPLVDYVLSDESFEDVKSRFGSVFGKSAEFSRMTPLERTLDQNELERLVGPDQVQAILSAPGKCSSRESLGFLKRLLSNNHYLLMSSLVVIGLAIVCGCLYPTLFRLLFPSSATK